MRQPRQTGRFVSTERHALKGPRPPCDFGKSLLVGIGSGLGFVVVLLLGIVLEFGGGSIAKGHEATRGGMELFLMLLFLPALCVVVMATLLCRIRGPVFTVTCAGIILSGVLVHDIVTSSPRAQLERLMKIEKLPKADLPPVAFEDFGMGVSFNDGSQYRWTARCALPEAEQLAAVLQLAKLPEVDVNDPPWPNMPDPAITDYTLFFDMEAHDGTIYFKGGRGFVAGYSRKEGVMRVGYSGHFISRIKKGEEER